MGAHRHLVRPASEEEGVRQAHEGVALAVGGSRRPGPLAHEGVIADGEVEPPSGVVRRSAFLVEQQAQPRALRLFHTFEQRHPALAVVEGLRHRVAREGGVRGLQAPRDGGGEIASALEVQGEDGRLPGRVCPRSGAR